MKIEIISINQINGEEEKILLPYNSLKELEEDIKNIEADYDYSNFSIEFIFPNGERAYEIGNTYKGEFTGGSFSLLTDGKKQGYMLSLDYDNNITIGEYIVQ